MRLVKASFSGLLLVFILCAASTAPAANVYRLGPAYDKEPELLVPNPNATTGSCGVERWAVKTGTDSDASLVDIATSTSATINQLTSIQPPATLPYDQRITPTETTVFTIDATLTKYKLEADSDYHLVIADGNGHTMIAEIPDPACVGATSPFLGDIQTARQVFDNNYSATGTFQTADIPVCLTGVGFFDFIHGQTGVAPNGIELHPVLGVQFNPSSCQPWNSTTPPTGQFLAPGPPVSTTAGSSVQFKVECTAGSNALASWRLDFGDGSTPATGNLSGTTNQTVSVGHTYKTAGSGFVATLVCIDTNSNISVPVTLTVTAKAQSSSGGGGAIGVWLLIGLGLLTSLITRKRRPI